VALLPDRLVGADIELQRWHPDMVDQMLAAVSASADELRQWMPWAQDAANRDATLTVLRDGHDLFDANQEWNYALIETTSDELVGSAGLHRVEDPNCPEIGYWVRTDRTGRGYATAAARVLAGAAFRCLDDVQRVKIRMDQANVASAAVPPKLGFQLFAEESREIETAGHTGKGYLWILERSNDELEL